MDRQINISSAEAKRVFDLLEKVNDLFHQPMKYKDSGVVESFVDVNYQEIKSLYYKVVWNWLPEDLQSEIENS